jgi:hypothetical protein
MMHTRVILLLNLELLKLFIGIPHRYRQGTNNERMDCAQTYVLAELIARIVIASKRSFTLSSSPPSTFHSHHSAPIS